jgi:outer membrane lipoprotein-sorting protein
MTKLVWLAALFTLGLLLSGCAQQETKSSAAPAPSDPAAAYEMALADANAAQKKRAITPRQRHWPTRPHSSTRPATNRPGARRTSETRAICTEPVTCSSSAKAGHPPAGAALR